MRNNAYMLVSMPSIPEIHDTKCMTTSNNNTADWKHSNWIPAVIISAWKPTMYCNATFCSLVFKKFDVSMCEPVMDCSVCHVQVETLWSKIVTIDQYVAVQNNTTLRFEYDSVTKATGISLDYQTFAEMNVTIESIQLTSTHILLFMQLSLELQTEIFMQARTQMMSQSLLCMQIQYSSCSDQSRLLCSNFNKDDKDNNNRQNYAMLKNDAINTNANVSLNLIFDFCKGADSKLMMSSQDLLATFTLQSKMKASVRYAVISAIIVNEESITKMDLKKPVNLASNVNVMTKIMIISEKDKIESIATPFIKFIDSMTVSKMRHQKISPREEKEYTTKKCMTTACQKIYIILLSSKQTPEWSLYHKQNAMSSSDTTAVDKELNTAQKYKVPTAVNKTARASVEFAKIDKVVAVVDLMKTRLAKILSDRWNLTQSCWMGSTRMSLPLTMFFNDSINTIATAMAEMDVASAASVLTTVDVKTTPQSLLPNHKQTIKWLKSPKDSICTNVRMVVTNKETLHDPYKQMFKYNVSDVEAIAEYSISTDVRNVIAEKKKLIPYKHMFQDNGSVAEAISIRKLVKDTAAKNYSSTDIDFFVDVNSKKLLSPRLLMVTRTTISTLILRPLQLHQSDHKLILHSLRQQRLYVKCPPQKGNIDSHPFDSDVNQDVMNNAQEESVAEQINDEIDILSPNITTFKKTSLNLTTINFDLFIIAETTPTLYKSKQTSPQKYRSYRKFLLQSRREWPRLQILSRRKHNIVDPIMIKKERTKSIDETNIYEPAVVDAESVAKPALVDAESVTVDADPAATVFDAKSVAVDANMDEVKVKSVTDDAKPAIVYAESIAVDAQPAAVDAESAAVDAESAAVDAKPAVAEPEAAAVDAKLAAVNDESVTVVAKKDVVEAESIAVNNKPDVVDAESAEVVAKPTVVEAESVAMDAKTAIIEVESAKVEVKLAAINADSAAVDAKPVIVDTESIAVEAEPAAVEAKLVVVKAESVAVGAKPAVVDAETVVFDAEPAEVDAESFAVDTTPNIIEVESVTVGIYLAAVDAESNAFDAKPATINAESDAVDAKPATIEAESDAVEPAIEADSAAVDAQPGAVDTKSVTVDAKPASIDAKSAAVDAKQVVFDAEPAALDAKSVVIDAESVAVDAESVAVDAESVPVISKPAQPGPAVLEAESVAVDVKPDIVEVKSVVVDARPAVVDVKSVAVNTKPAVVDTKAVATGTKPAEVDDNSVAVVANPAIVKTEPDAVDIKPTIIEVESAAPDVCLAVVNAESIVVDAKPAKIDAESAIIDAKLAIVDAESATVDAKSIIADTKSIAVDTEPASVDAKPAVVEAKSVVVDDKLAIVKAESVAVDAESSAVDTKPTAVEEKSVAFDAKPSVDEAETVPVDAKPAVVDAESVTVDTKPAVVDAKAVAVDGKLDAQPFVVDAETAVVVAKPSIVEAESVAVDAKPAIIEVELTAIDVYLAVLGADSLAVDAKPAVIDVVVAFDTKPAIIDAEPAAVNTKLAVDAESATVDDKPVIVNTESIAVDAKPAIIDIESPEIVAEPAAVDARSVVVDAESVAVADESAAVEAESVVVEAKLAAVDAESVAIVIQPAVVEVESVTIDTKPAIAEAKPITIDTEPALVAAESVVENAKPTVVDPEANEVDAKPAIVNAESAAADAKPAVVDAESAALNAEPAEVDVESVAVDTKPAIFDAESAAIDTKLTLDAESDTVDAESVAVNAEPTAAEVKSDEIDAESLTVETDSDAAVAKSYTDDPTELKTTSESPLLTQNLKNTTSAVSFLRARHLMVPSRPEWLLSLKNQLFSICILVITSALNSSCIQQFQYSLGSILFSLYRSVQPVSSSAQQEKNQKWAESRDRKDIKLLLHSNLLLWSTIDNSCSPSEKTPKTLSATAHAVIIEAEVITEIIHAIDINSKARQTVSLRPNQLHLMYSKFTSPSTHYYHMLSNDSSTVTEVTLWYETRTFRPEAFQIDNDFISNDNLRWVLKIPGGAKNDRKSSLKPDDMNAESEPPQQALRRSLRSCVLTAATIAPPVIKPNAYIVYNLGKLPRSDRHKWLQLLTDFHSDESVQQTVADILDNAQQYLQWKDASHELNYESSQVIPKGTRLCFFGGNLTTRGAAPRSNHLISVGKNLDGNKYEVVVDGQRVSSQGLGLGQAMNHSCNPNAEVEVIETASGLDLLIIKASEDIPARVEVNINYDQKANAKDKRDRKTFWEWNLPTTLPPTGLLHRIFCNCAKQHGGQTCPNKLWRDEKRLRKVTTWYMPSPRKRSSAGCSIQMDSSSNVSRAQNFSPTSHNSSAAPRLTTLMVDDQRELPSSQTTKSQSLITTNNNRKRSVASLPEVSIPNKRMAESSDVARRIAYRPQLKQQRLNFTKTTSSIEISIRQTDSSTSVIKAPATTSPIDTKYSDKVRKATQQLEQVMQEDRTLSEKLKEMKKARIEGSHQHEVPNPEVALLTTVLSDSRCLNTDQIAAAEDCLRKLKQQDELLHDCAEELRKATSEVVMSNHESLTQDTVNQTPVQVMADVYSLPMKISTTQLSNVSNFLQTLMQYSRRNLTLGPSSGTVPRGRDVNPTERLETDLSLLYSLRRHSKHRTPRLNNFIKSNLQGAQETLMTLDTLMWQFKAALKDLNIRNIESWTYYVYCLDTLPGTPSQPVHQDHGHGCTNTYFTLLIPVSEMAELTEFGEGPEFQTFRGPIMFSGKAWHRAPKVTRHRTVLSAVACKVSSDTNHDSAIPYPWQSSNDLQSPLLVCIPTAVDTDSVAAAAKQTVVDYKAVAVDVKPAIVDAESFAVDAKTVVVDAEAVAIVAEPAVVQAESVAVDAKLAIIKAELAAVDTKLAGVDAKSAAAVAIPVAVYANLKLIAVEADTTAADAEPDAIDAETPTINAESAAANAHVVDPTELEIKSVELVKPMDSTRGKTAFSTENGLVFFNQTIRNLGNTCYFNSTMQLFASIPEFVAEISAQAIPENLQDSSICLSYLKSLIPRIARKSPSPNHALYLPDSSNDADDISWEGMKDFIFRITSQYDLSYRPERYADPADLIKYMLSILPSTKAMLSFDSKLTIRPACRCSDHGTRVYSYYGIPVNNNKYAAEIWQRNKDESERRRHLGLCLRCQPESVVPAEKCLIHSSKNPISIQSQVYHPVHYHPFPHFQQDTDIPIVLKSRDSLLQHVLAYFAQEPVSEYICDLCHISANDLNPAIKRRFLASLPRFLMITITESLGSNGLPTEQHPFGPLREFEQLDLSSVYQSCPPIKSCYTLCTAILYRHRHHWTYLHGPPAVIISDDCSRIATSDDLAEVASCARILIYKQLEHAPPDDRNSQQPRRKEELANAFIQTITTKHELRLNMPFKKIQENQAPDSVMVGLRTRLCDYDQYWKSINSRPDYGQNTISSLPTNASIQENFQNLNTYLKEMYNRLRHKLVATTPEAWNDEVNSFFITASMNIHQLLWSLEWKLHTAVRSIYDFRNNEKLDEVSELLTASTALSQFITNQRHRQCLQKRLLLLQSLRSMKVQLHELPYHHCDETTSRTDPEHQKYLLQQSIVRRTLQHSFIQAADSTAGIQKWKIGDKNATTCIISIDGILKTYVFDNSDACELVQSLGIQRYRTAVKKAVQLHSANGQQITQNNNSEDPCPQSRSSSKAFNIFDRKVSVPRQVTLGDFLIKQPTKLTQLKGNCHPSPASPEVVVAHSTAHSFGHDSDQKQDHVLTLSAHAPQFTSKLNPPTIRSPVSPSLSDRVINRMITTKDIPETTPWKPGTLGLYPRPLSMEMSKEQNTSFPIWNAKQPGFKRQDAMFLSADKISPNAFYVAADEWTRKDGKDWGVGKLFGAFQSASHFVTQFLEIAPNRCFYELIRKNRPCKAYFDLEAEAGALTEEQGWSMCTSVIQEWRRRIQCRWPQATSDCPKCLASMTLCGSRMTDEGWKTSFHVIFPWLIFPCNTTSLRDEIGTMSDLQHLWYTSKDGSRKRFIDSGVYTSNRQFRLLLCYKLTDRSRTPLQLSRHPTISQFEQTCITQIAPDAWWVPHDAIPPTIQNKHPKMQNRPTTLMQATIPSTDSKSSEIIVLIRRLLQQIGQPDGSLSPASGSSNESTFRWQVLNGTVRPCSIAQIWRPLQPTHMNNGAWVSIDHNRQVFLKCLHPECQRLDKGRGLFIGHIPLQIDTRNVTRDGNDARHYNFSRKRLRSIDLPCRRITTFQRDSQQPTEQSSETSIDDADNKTLENPALSQSIKTPSQQKHPRSHEQSITRVIRENQYEKDATIQAWTVEVGPFGGRVRDDQSLHDQTKSQVYPQHSEDCNTNICEWLEQPPFQQSAPTSFINQIYTKLEIANNEHSIQCGAVLDSWQQESLTTPPLRNEQSIENTKWSIHPAEIWFQTPIGLRSEPGINLLDTAYTAISQGKTHELGSKLAEEMDLWTNPFNVSYLNVGFRRFKESISGIVELVLKHRPDILFLGDLVTARHHIGRLKKRLEHELGDEWFFHSDISALPGRPVGIGVVIHCSLAAHTTVIKAVCPTGADQEAWSQAIPGRFLHLQVSRPDLSFTWHLVGVYQHVAERANVAARALICDTLQRVLTDSKTNGNHRTMMIGDTNSAPKKGRWGYSSTSYTKQADRIMDEWVARCNLREILSVPLQPTWRANHFRTKAALDRIFLSHDDIPSSQLLMDWNDHHISDHAMITIQLPSTIAGIGYAGACRPDSHTSPQGRVNLQKWRERLDEWKQLLQSNISPLDDAQVDTPRDPYLELKIAEAKALSIAEALAPKHIRKPNEVRSSFCFAGNRTLFRELNLLRNAQSLVVKMLIPSDEIMHSPHRFIRWTLEISRLHLRIRRSMHTCPPPLLKPPQYYFHPKARPELQEWLLHAKTAMAVRHAASRELYEKARFTNARNYQYKLNKTKIVLDKITIANALGKRQPRQRMWALSPAGSIIMGVKLELKQDQQMCCLNELRRMSSSKSIVSIHGNNTSLQLWFRGPKQAGDFLDQWCSEVHHFSLSVLHPQKQYIAISPDDMLAIQEWHMANEGMETGSICPRCSSPGLQPISTGATQQRFGNPKRAVKFFCGQCTSVHETVAYAPLPPCPIPISLLEAMRKIPPGTLPLISRMVDMETVISRTRRQGTGLSTGSDRFHREFYKDAPLILLERLWAAINAYLRGDPPTVCAHEWIGAIAAHIPKKLAALISTEFRPVASICAKYIITLDIINQRVTQTEEDYKLQDDAQEGFRRDRSTHRQLNKLGSILAEQRRNRRHRRLGQSISVIIYLDIKNAFNAMNHRSIFYMLEVYGFPKEDVDLFRRMYNGTFLVMINTFGVSAACFLSRGVPQGAPPSSSVFNMIYDPVHVLIRASGRGSTIPIRNGTITTGSSGFADDTALHTAGPDAVPAMCYLVTIVGNYLYWVGLTVNMPKSACSAFNFATRQQVATDSITLNGQSFPVLPPDQAHKYLGLRVTLTNDWTAEKEHVMSEMKQRIAALSECEVLSPSFKELTIKIGVVSKFRYSAGLVPWSKEELNNITKLWTRAYKQAWALPTTSDGSPMILSRQNGGRQCPDATEVWIRAAIDVLDQCISLPGDISLITVYNLQRLCNDHGCHTLNQLQLLFRVGVLAESIPELLLLRLDEQGMELSSPWPQHHGLSIIENIWPNIWNAWLEKERWAGCTELDEDVQHNWKQTQLCLHACEKLGSAKEAILNISQLCKSNGHWASFPDLQRSCHLTKEEHAALMNYLEKVDIMGMDKQQHPSQQQPLSNRPNESQVSFMVKPPPCIIGKMSRLVEHDQIELTSLHDAVPNVLIAALSNDQLATYLCKTRAVFSFTLDGDNYQQVECLTPLSNIVPHTFPEDCVVVQSFTPNYTTIAPRLAALGLAFIRDCLLNNGCENLREACSRPPWLVEQEDLYEWYSPPRPMVRTTQWTLSEQPGNDQTFMTGIVLGMKRRRPAIIRPLPPMHPWQSEPPLPSHVTIDFSHHHPKILPCPLGWMVMQRNGRVWITRDNTCPLGLDAAQYGMLINLSDKMTLDGPSESLLHQIRYTCLAQRQADTQYNVQWSRHLIACLQKLTNATLLIGASAVTYNPHFRYFSSPIQGDLELGAVHHWPPEPALLLLDSFAPDTRQSILQSASNHCAKVWILRLDRRNESALLDLQFLRSLGSTLCALLPAKSRVLHETGCWEEAKWDVYPSDTASQLWTLHTKHNSDRSRASIQPYDIQQAIGNWEQNRYDFHWREDPIPRALGLHRENQQDALRLSWPADGLVAGTDGGVQWKKERMAAGYVAGNDPIPLMSLSAPVGGPLASLRAEGASLLHFIQKAADKYGRQVHLLVFIDCLVLLDILHKWGKSNFHPRPKDIAHFDIILPLLNELRQWIGNVVLIKIKSHTGCLLNERADEYAELGYTSEHETLCNGPDKYGSLWLRIRPKVRDLAKDHNQQLQSDRAPNKRIIEKVISANALRAVKMRSTIFAKDILHRKEGETILRIVTKCPDAIYRTWLKTVTGIYPVQTYLRRIGKADSDICPHCALDVPETLTHFANVCPKFHDARTAAHNQVRSVISTFLNKHCQTNWTLHEETRMDATGLILCPVSTTSMIQAGRRVSEDEQAEGLVGIARLGRLQPDFLSYSSADKRIAILDLCRPSDVHADQLFIAYTRKRTSYTPLSNALQYYKAAGWEIRIFPLVIGIRGFLNLRHIQEAFAFLQIPRKEWNIGIELFAIASVKAFSFLHRIRYSARPLDPGNAAREVIQFSDPDNDSDNMATSEAEDSADEDKINTTIRIKKNAQVPTISTETNITSFQKKARTCPAPRNSKKKEKVIKNFSMKACRSSITSQASDLAVVSKVTRYSRHSSRARKSCKQGSNVSNVLQSKRRLCKQARVTPNVSRQLRPRPFKVDELQYKTYDTNDPNHLIKNVQLYPPGYDSQKWTQWKQLERDGRGKT